MAEPVGIAIEHVSKSFGAVQALLDIDITVKAGEFLSLIGPSGCGKTTLLKCMAGLNGVDAGRIVIGGRTVEGPGGREASLVFQDFALLPWASARENAEFGLRLRGAPAAERAQAARRALAKVGLAGSFEEAYPAQLSGGMQQRVGLARALAVNPQVLLMDEPFASIDEQTRRILQDDLLRLWSEERKTVVLVTHSMEEAIYLSDRVVILSPRPGKVHRLLDVPLPRPRETLDVRASGDFARLVDELWQVLKKMQ
jgi:ABC-type nitrate/sulfonate/bicarbonate transport system ATPase subunit